MSVIDLETYLEHIDWEYIQVLKFIDDLYKHARPQVPLKNILDYLGNNYSFIDLALYQKMSYSYVLVKPTGILNLETSTEVIKSIYDCLDNTQTGISHPDADMQPFKDFYFKFSEASRFYDYVVRNSSKIQTIAARQSKAPPPPNHSKTVSTFKKKTIGDLIKEQQHESVISPNEYQRITMLYDYFTPHQACCFVAGLHPAFNGSDDGFEIALGVIEGGIKKGRLTLDDDGQLNSDDLKSFLHSKDWVMTGFNDNLTNNTTNLDRDNPAYKKRVTQLEKQLADAEAEITELNRQLKERPIAIDEDLKEIPHQSMRTVLRVMYAMAKLTKLDNSAPYGKNRGSLNCEIVTLLQNEGLGLKFQSVGRWLTEIDDVPIIKR